jgi:hypothetical protein
MSSSGESWLWKIIGKPPLSIQHLQVAITANVGGCGARNIGKPSVVPIQRRVLQDEIGCLWKTS